MCKTTVVLKSIPDDSARMGFCHECLTPDALVKCKMNIYRTIKYSCWFASLAFFLATSIYVYNNERYDPLKASDTASPPDIFDRVRAEQFVATHPGYRFVQSHRDALMTVCALGVLVSGSGSALCLLAYLLRSARRIWRDPSVY
jgi:hypothetical protein